MVKRILFSLLLMLGMYLQAGQAMASGIDLTKAVVIGNGPKKVIEFTDPDCPFCRKAALYFHNRRDVTCYVFFTPLAMHPYAHQKAHYILSGTDKARLYYEVMSGSVDKLDSRTLPVTQAGGKLLEEQQAIAKKVGVDATPTFMIMGRIIEGFDQKKIDELLGNQ